MNRRIIILFIFLVLVSALIWNYWPVDVIPTGVMIDRLEVHKSERKLYAYAKGELVTIYTIALGKQPIGPKRYEGDMRTPEGDYVIDSRNPNSDFHVNLGISYPNDSDLRQAKNAQLDPGGAIKIHGLKNGWGFVGRFHRWVDWTNGCIAVTNAEADQLYKHVRAGAKISILK
jgi:murein L,D-transpeptidase YafK